MQIKLSRIDDRLIHGQVQQYGQKEAGAKRIIVVSKEVANMRFVKHWSNKQPRQESK